MVILPDWADPGTLRRHRGEETMKNRLTDTPSPEHFPNFVIYEIDDAKVNIDVLFQDETLWLTQKQIAELFDKGRSTITEHLKNIFASGELDEQVVCRNFRHTAQHGAINGKTQTKEVKYYSLRAITAVGYRVNSYRATAFRRWATEVLHEYIIKGFAMDDERLKNVQHFGKDYFDEQLERIVSAYLDLAENRARRNIVMNMKDWIVFLDKFLELSEYPILKDKGKISTLQARLKAEAEYEKYRVVQDREYLSDFDRLLLEAEEKNRWQK
jgi:hypothetical protein